MVQKALFPSKVTRKALNSLVDKAADIIRTATDYKFILVLLFLKRVSDVWNEEFEEKKVEYMKFLDEKAAENEAENEVYHTFNLRRELLWNEMTQDIRKLPEKLTNTLVEIGKLNKDLDGVINKFSFLGFTAQENREKLRQLIELFNQFNLGNKNVSDDIVGDCYEHILRKFIPMTKKEAKQGEFYTPREVIQLMVAILDPKPNQSIYDPACGFGGMLIVCHKHVREKHGKEEKLLLYGQELNPEIYGLCKLNLKTYGIFDPFVEWGDSLLYPRFTEEGKLKLFDVVIANPPWNQDGYGEEVLKGADFRERYLFGYPPRDKADSAWIQHMLASSKERVGIVLDQGPLFRSGCDENVRKQLVENDWVECVILLPEKLFYNTPASGIIIILSKNKTQGKKEKVLLINALEEYERHPYVKRLNILSSDNIEKIAKSYRDFEDCEGFARIVSLDEIRKNDYDLNVTRYAYQLPKDEAIDLKKVYGELRRLRGKREENWQKIENYIQEVLNLWAKK